ncbi:uncharacterized protein LOC124545452 isoform X1 [Schistocerca americana]|uniref:uncharacterized protein LOC124545452 isoform X1 n=1 Tax=Schistocerca americana TaxID=7009 RepID=UPI001F4FE6E6|nr:uncharacterized protein LOC124545452 isoform X1 [Schistocerca americana]XP_049794228.1 uncharacterized protein LOC126203888 isoform X1 [Schistocerca nitens]XP_049942412.1 uncharacterized protein LOC126419291 isoform X1 [Schistocerca serialis cubense]
MSVLRRTMQVALVLCCAAVVPCVLAKMEEGAGKRVAKQIHTKAAVVDSENDHNAAETGFGGGGVGGHGKYFQDFYMLLYGPLQMEYGHVCEDPERWEQRFERRDFQNHRHQGQARWGDKHGGYGEHYWDYNHAGHHEDGGDDGGDGGYSEPVPEYKAAPGAHHKVTAKRQSDAAAAPAAPTVSEARVKKSAGEPRLVLDVATGRVVDEASGQQFTLTPVN